MREDMDKVIVERPRANRTWAVKGNYGLKHKLDLEDMPTRESYRNARRKRKTKYFNEHLSPLKRFLQSSVGKPWNKVYSEICERIHVKSTVQAHILQHIADFVCMDTFLKDGKVWARPGGGFRIKGEEPIEESHFELYVHPIDGLLKRVKRPEHSMRFKRNYVQRPRQSKDIVTGPDGAQFHKFHGIWYMVHLRPIPRMLCAVHSFRSADGKKHDIEIPTGDGAIRDALLNQSLYGFSMRTLTGGLTATYGQPGVYGASLKQMNSKELKAAGLKNDAPAV
ncbi:MAG TPA: hypothetical protein VKX17_08830 [Planctomycetota bacterium]|nr:hypothetical protein [Planctomycetota bacterium]